MISDRALFRFAGIVTLAVLALAAFDTWRVNRNLAARAGRGSPIIDTTGIRG